MPKNFWFPKNLHEVRKEYWRQNSPSQGHIQIDFKPFFDRKRSFYFNRKKYYQK